MLIGLLSHENADIVIDVVEVVHELTDEDVGNEGEEDEDDEKNAEGALKLLIEGLVSVLCSKIYYFLTTYRMHGTVRKLNS